MLGRNIQINLNVESFLFRGGIVAVCICVRGQGRWVVLAMKARKHNDNK